MAGNMEEPMSAAWGLVLSDADWEKLRVGLQAYEMEDRWLYNVDEIDVSGVITIHIQRSWTGIEIYAIHVKPRRDEEPDEPTRIIAITWEQNKNGILITEEQAKIEVAILTREVSEAEAQASQSAATTGVTLAMESTVNDTLGMLKVI
ncbi:hypothetical protein Sste5344_010221 [Sporothrix stenoceras]